MKPLSPGMGPAVSQGATWTLILPTLSSHQSTETCEFAQSERKKKKKTCWGTCEAIPAEIWTSLPPKQITFKIISGVPCASKEKRALQRRQGKHWRKGVLSVRLHQNMTKLCQESIKCLKENFSRKSKAGAEKFLLCLCRRHSETNLFIGSLSSSPVILLLE